MFLSNFSIKRPVATIVIIIALMGLGLLALGKLRVNQIPDVEQPVLAISIDYPGASPETVEREVVDRIEKALQSISGVDEVRSTASEGNAKIVMIFNFGKNMVEAADEVRNAIGTVRYKLPVEMREPVLQRVDPAAQPIMQLALSSTTLGHAEISHLAEDEIADRFRAIPGVAIVSVNGALRRELSVLLHAEKLREFNISVTEVVNALRNQNATAPVGKVRGTLEDQSIRLVGRIESPAQFEQIVVQPQRRPDRAAGPACHREGWLRGADGLLAAQRAAQRGPVDHACARRQHRERGQRCTSAGGDDQQDAARGDAAGSHPGRRRERAEQPRERHRRPGLRRGPDGVRRLPVPEFLAFHADHRAEPADFGDRRLHRGVAVWLHAQLHESPGAVAGHRRAHRRRDRRAREHRAPHGARRGPPHGGAARHGGDRAGGGRHDLLHRGGLRARWRSCPAWPASGSGRSR